MRLRVSVEVWCTTFAAAFGLLPGCGGQAFSPSGATTGGAAAGGATNTGGVGHTGGAKTGGTSAGGTLNSGGSGGQVITITGGGGTGGSSGGPAGGSGGDVTTNACSNPQPILVNGSDTGFVSCDNGLKHRAKAVTCVSKLPRDAVCTDLNNPGGVDGCTKDADCTASPNGYCATNSGGQVPGCNCQYGCVSDANCGEGQICECGDPVGQCVPSNCKDDSACGANSLCATYTNNTCYQHSFACQTPEDSCLTDTECGAGSFCTLAATASRQCQSRIQCAVIGRPFLVLGTERLAPLSNTAGWQSSDTSPDLSTLDAATRFELAEAWAKNGLMEHASIAAFARFSLQLMAIGAPAELLAQSQSAMADETRHAKDCFALASAFAGTRLGPGPLAIEHSLDDITPEQILITTILEGCIGETVAAVEAEEALCFAADPAVRRVLQQIATDESKHAALAWQTVRFLLVEHPQLTSIARNVFAEAAREMPSLQAKDETSALLAFGVLGSERRREIRRQVMTSVVARCAAGLFEAGGSSRYAS